eukprot:172580-Rhodomonas_salina.1
MCVQFKTSVAQRNVIAILVHPLEHRPTRCAFSRGSLRLGAPVRLNDASCFHVDEQPGDDVKARIDCATEPSDVAMPATISL